MATTRRYSYKLVNLEGFADGINGEDLSSVFCLDVHPMANIALLLVE